MTPEFFKDEDLATLPFEARLFFEGLWCYADRAGRLEDRPKYLKVEIFPYDDVDVEKLLNMLANPKIEDRPEKCFIHRYAVNGKKYIQINEFLKHQSPHSTEKESEIPLFNESTCVKDTLDKVDVQDAHYPKPMNLTNDPKPVWDVKRKKPKTPLPYNFEISDRVRKWASEKGHTNLDQHLESFKLKCRAKGYMYVNWDDAFMNAIRDNWANIGNGSNNQPPRASPQPTVVSCPACGDRVLKSALTETGCVQCDSRRQVSH